MVAVLADRRPGQDGGRRPPVHHQGLDAVGAQGRGARQAGRPGPDDNHLEFLDRSRHAASPFIGHHVWRIYHFIGQYV